MVEISSSTIGSVYIQKSLESIAVSPSTSSLTSYAVASYYYNLAANVLCSIFYNNQCQNYEMTEVAEYIKAKGYPVVDVLAYCYAQYKKLLEPTTIAYECKHLLMDSEPGVYSLDVLEILDRVEAVPPEFQKKYLLLEKVYPTAQAEMSGVLSLRVNNRYTYYKGHVKKLFEKSSHELHEWNTVELFLFMTAFNHRLAVPKVFVKNALKNDLVAIYIQRCRNYAKQTAPIK
jgi:hypothetical protein